MDPAGGRVERRAAGERVVVAEGRLIGLHRQVVGVAAFEVALAEGGLDRAAESLRFEAEVHAVAVDAGGNGEHRDLGGLGVILEDLAVDVELGKAGIIAAAEVERIPRAFPIHVAHMGGVKRG